MAEERLFTVRDVSLYLGITEKEVMDLAEGGQLPAYKVGGVYLRFKRDQIEQYRASSTRGVPAKDEREAQSFSDRLSDFFYFNDFYILAAILIFLILVVIFRG